MKVVDFFGVKNRSKVRKVRAVKPTPFLDIKPKTKQILDIKPPRQIKGQKQRFPSKKNMNWFQAKQKNPNLSPWADADKDGLINIFDCKPFNKKKRDVPHNPSPVQVHSQSQPLGRPALGGESYAGKPSDSKAPVIQGGTKILAGQGTGSTTTTTPVISTTQKTSQIPVQTHTPVKSQAQISIQSSSQTSSQVSSKPASQPQQKLYGGLTAEQRFAATIESLKQAGDLNKPTLKGIITTAAYYAKPAATTADPLKINTALTYVGQAIQAIPGSRLRGFSPQEAAQKRQDIMQRAYTEYSYDPKTGKEIGKVEPGMTVAQKVGAVLQPAYKTSVGQNLIVTAAALPIGYAVGTVLKGVPTVVSTISPKATQVITQAVTSPAGQTAIKTLGAGALAYGGYKAVAEPTIKAVKEGLPTGEVVGTAVTKGLGYGGAIAMGVEGVKAGLRAPINVIEKGQHIIQRTVEAIPISDKGGTLGRGIPLSDKAARLEAISSSSSKFDKMLSNIRTPEERIQIIEQAFKDYLDPTQKAAITKAVAQEVAKLK